MMLWMVNWYCSESGVERIAEFAQRILKAK